MIALGRSHAIAGLEVRYVAADVGDDTGYLVPEDERHLDAGLERAVAGDDVVETHAATVYLDDDVLRTGHRILDGLHVQHIDPAGLLHDHRFHNASPTGWNFKSVTSGEARSKTADTRMPVESSSLETPTMLEKKRTPLSSFTWMTA